MYGRVEVLLHNFLKVATDSDEWTHSQPKCFIPRERAFCTHTKQGETQSQLVWYREEKNLAFARIEHIIFFLTEAITLCSSNFYRRITV